MGNSGSVHNVATGLEDIGRHSQHTHYQHHQKPPPYHQLQQNELTSLNWSQSYMRDGTTPQSQSHIKVLPELSKLARLRTTTNGAILQSGGTISGRQNNLPEPSPPPPVLLQRTRTSINYDLLQRRGPPKPMKDDFQHSKLHLIPDSATKHESPVAYKRFGSEPDLRGSGDEDYTNAQQNARIAKSKLARTKKKKAAPAPPPTSIVISQEPVTVSVQQAESKSQEPQRKLRLFKTKAESRKTSSALSSSKFAAEASDLRLRQLSLDEPAAQSFHSAAVPKPPAVRKESKAMPVFRREKSFDITLLRNRQHESDEVIKGARDRQRFGHVAPSPDLTVSVTRQSLAEPDRRKSVLETKLWTRKLSQQTKFEGNIGSNFQQELEAATKRRSLNVTQKVDKSSQDLSQIPQLRAVSKTQNSKGEPQGHKKEASPAPPPPPTRPESKIPQLTKTFYFGMGKSSPGCPTNTAQADSFGKIQMEVIDQFAKSILTTQRYQGGGSESSESALSSEEGFQQNAGGPYDDSNDERIQVHVRPTLPRRQLEIPRFSPAAAWRLLNEGRSGDGPFVNSNGEMTSGITTIEPPRQPLEERIQRIYREPILAYPDNKSGDSGISGDAGLPERPESPRQEFEVKVGPFLGPWTPQQDLEEDTSSDGGGEMEKTDGSGGDLNKNPSRGHVFSLSLPRDSHISVYGEKDKPGFNSLQKLKRTVSGVFTANQTNPDRNDLNFRSDNWLLSRSAPNSIDNSQISTVTAAGNNFQDIPLVTQTAAFGYLTGGKHVMYLPNQPIDESTDDFYSSFSPIVDSVQLTAEKPQENNMMASNQRENLQDDEEMHENTFPFPVKSNGKIRAHRFTFQSTIRQIERRRIADKLSKEAEQKEAQRLSELEAMRRVEEEFQRKRAREKASIRHQLRIFSLEENQCTSLPVDWQIHSQNGGVDDDAAAPHHEGYPLDGRRQQRAEPDGAVSSPASSPTQSPLTQFRPLNDTKSPYAARIIEQKSARKGHRSKSKILPTLADYRQPPPPPPSLQTKIISEYRTSRREYFEYRSSDDRKLQQMQQQQQPNQTEHPQIVCTIPSKSNQPSYLYNDDDDDFMDQKYRRDSKRHGRSVCSSDSDISTPSSNGLRHYQSRYEKKMH